jgi:hypothetical protein
MLFLFWRWFVACNASEDPSEYVEDAIKDVIDQKANAYKDVGDEIENIDETINVIIIFRHVRRLVPDVKMNRCEDKETFEQTLCHWELYSGKGYIYITYSVI